MHPRSFPLERAYRKTFHRDLVDLSSSAAASPAFGDLLDVESLAGLSLGYEPGGGSWELRAAVAALYDGITADNVLITAGATEAIRAVAMATVAPGQRVVVQEPAYDALRQAVLDAGGCVSAWRSDHCGTTLAQAGRDANASLALINSPHGPDGAILRDLEDFEGRIVVDEVYRPIALTPARVRSCIDYLPGSVAIGDLSKPLGLGGLRIGWIVSKDIELIERCADALDYLSGSVSALSAAVALRALSRFDELMAPRIEQARANLLRLASFVEGHRRWLTWTPPQAGYTACLRLRSGPPPADLFDNLRARGVFLLDGNVFGLPDCLRIGLGMAPAVFDVALDALGEELRKLTPSCSDSADAQPDVILYTKVPMPGEGKSRLAADIGRNNAAVLAGAFLNDTLRLATCESRRLFVALAGRGGIEGVSSELESVLPDGCIYAQRGEGMGERLATAFEDAFARGAESPVLIGSDSPTLPGHLLAVARQALQTHDVVIGPASDGGYYAIGLRRPAPALFENIDWSTERTLQQTVERAECAGLSVFFLPPWYDIDTVEDLSKLREDARLGSATAAALRRIGEIDGNLGLNSEALLVNLGLNPRASTGDFDGQVASGLESGR